MTQEEHLKKIVAKCRELLAIAEKRTPVGWAVTGRDAKDCRQYVKIRGTSLGRKHKIADLPFFIEGGGVSDLIETERDAAFIAACAGTAEAGWRATIAAIELIQHNKWWHLSYGIIAAWPEELL